MENEMKVYGGGFVGKERTTPQVNKEEDDVPILPPIGVKLKTDKKTSTSKQNDDDVPVLPPTGVTFKKK